MRRHGPTPFKGYDGPWLRPPTGADRRAMRRAENKGASPVELVTLDQLIYLQDGRCWICRVPLVDDWSRDHVVPLAMGGDHTYNNVKVAHRRCNEEKGDLHPDHVFYAPAVWDIDQRVL